MWEPWIGFELWLIACIFIFCHMYNVSCRMFGYIEYYSHTLLFSLSYQNNARSKTNKNRQCRDMYEDVQCTLHNMTNQPAFLAKYDCSLSFLKKNDAIAIYFDGVKLYTTPPIQYFFNQQEIQDLKLNLLLITVNTSCRNRYVTYECEKTQNHWLHPGFNVKTNNHHVICKNRLVREKETKGTRHVHVFYITTFLKTAYKE